MQSSFTNLDAVTGFDAFADLEAPTEIDVCVTGLDADVDNLFRPPPSASLGRFLTSRLMRQVKPKLVEDIDIGTVHLDAAREPRTSNNHQPAQCESQSTGLQARAMARTAHDELACGYSHE